MQNEGEQFYAVRVTTDPAEGIQISNNGPTAAGEAVYLPDSGPVKKPSVDFTLGAPFGIMNPFLTLNYIIRSGPPAFTTVGS